MAFVLVEYTAPSERVQIYQEIVRGGTDQHVRYADIDGNTIDLPELCESRVVNKKATAPVWAEEGRIYFLMEYWGRSEPKQGYAYIEEVQIVASAAPRVIPGLPPAPPPPPPQKHVRAIHDPDTGEEIKMKDVISITPLEDQPVKIPQWAETKLAAVEAAAAEKK